MPKKKRFQGQTYVITTPTAGAPVTLGNLKGIPRGHRVYLVNVLNASTTVNVTVGTDNTGDYLLVAGNPTGAAKDFFFVDPALVTFAPTASAVTLYVDVSGEFPGTCPLCDQADG